MTIVPHHDLRARFMAKVRVSSDCWEWLAYKDPSGYGAMKVGGVRVNAHRVSHELFKGEIPDGMWIDHLCRNRGCVNPDHLEAVEPRVNTLRGVGPLMSILRAEARTQCDKGHELTSDNIVSWTGRKNCLTCYRAKERSRKRISRAKARAAQVTA